MAEPPLYAAAQEAVDYIQARTRVRPQVGIVLGSGLSPLAERLTAADRFPYAEIPHFHRSTVQGHTGALLLGELAGVPTLIMQGRTHYYEGYPLAQVTLPIRVMQLMGIGILIVTNAAGGVRPGFAAGDLMAITDHINLVGMAGHNPLQGPNDERLGPRFPDMSRAYDPKLLDLLRAEAQAQNISLREGVYMMLAGPNFETPAEVRMARLLGADAVGMSTAPEVVVARHGGMRVLGISLISNVAIDSTETETYAEASHSEVLEAGRQAVPRLTSLIEGLLRRIAKLN